MRGRVEVADVVSAFPGEEGMVFDDVLVRRHMDSWERAGEPKLAVDTESYVKGFVYGDDPELVAGIRAESDPDERVRARTALDAWANERGAGLRFDDSFDNPTESGLGREGG